jgi:hypothetical protein
VAEAKEKTGKIREVAGTVAQGAIKYLIYVVVVVGSIAAVFYTSQAAQDKETAGLSGRVFVAETNITALNKCDDQTAAIIDATKKDLADTRIEMTKIATSQEVMSREQRTLSTEQTKLNEKMDELKIILIRMEKKEDDR